MTQNPKSQRFKVVVVGGGAGGLELATRLGGRLGRKPGVEIELIDRNHTHIWKPLLHEVAAGTLNSSDDELSYLAQAYWHDFHFHLGALEGVDRRTRTITIAPSHDTEGHEYIPRRTFDYDVLIIAVGSVTNDFGIPGVAEHCYFLDSRQQADAFHQVLIHTCYAANEQTDPLREGQLHIAIAGAGATGVELAAELHHAIRALVRFGLNRIDPERDFKIHLVESSARILPGLSPQISAATQSVLAAIGVQIHTDEFVVEADARGLRTRSGKVIPAEIKVWAAGIRGPEVLAKLEGLEVNRQNQLVVKSTLQTTRDADIFAFGDCAACPRSGADSTAVPPRAQAAHQQAALIAESIVHRHRGSATLPEFRYRDFGSLINLSGHSTIGNLMGNLGGRPGSVSIEGWFARMAYLSLYKMHQLTVQGPVRTTLLTIANLLTRSSKPRLKLH